MNGCCCSWLLSFLPKLWHNAQPVHSSAKHSSAVLQAACEWVLSERFIWARITRTPRFYPTIAYLCVPGAVTHSQQQQQRWSSENCVCQHDAAFKVAALDAAAMTRALFVSSASIYKPYVYFPNLRDWAVLLLLLLCPCHVSQWQIREFFRFRCNQHTRTWQHEMVHPFYKGECELCVYMVLLASRFYHQLHHHHHQNNQTLFYLTLSLSWRLIVSKCTVEFSDNCA